MTAFTNVTGHQVDVYFLGRQIEEQATSQTNITGR
jgi:hypothetical protein